MRGTVLTSLQTSLLLLRGALKLAPFPTREGGWGLDQIVFNSTVKGKGELVAIAFQIKNSFLQAPIHRTTWVSAIDVSQ